MKTCEFCWVWMMLGKSVVASPARWIQRESESISEPWKYASLSKQTSTLPGLKRTSQLQLIIVIFFFLWMQRLYKLFSWKEPQRLFCSRPLTLETIPRSGQTSGLFNFIILEPRFVPALWFTWLEFPLKGLCYSLHKAGDRNPFHTCCPSVYIQLNSNWKRNRPMKVRTEMSKWENFMQCKSLIMT